MMGYQISAKIDCCRKKRDEGVLGWIGSKLRKVEVVLGSLAEWNVDPRLETIPGEDGGSSSSGRNEGRGGSTGVVVIEIRATTTA